MNGNEIVSFAKHCGVLYCLVITNCIVCSLVRYGVVKVHLHIISSGGRVDVAYLQVATGGSLIFFFFPLNNYPVRYYYK